MRAKDVVVEDVHSQTVLGDEVAPYRLFVGVASIRPSPQFFCTEDLQRRAFSSGGIPSEARPRSTWTHLVEAVLVAADGL